MEMDSVEGNHHGDFNEDEFAENSFSAEASDRSGVLGDPEIPPRVGDEYQVEVPSLIAVSDYLWLLKNPTVAEIATGGSYGLIAGLPVPVMWINEGVDGKKHEPETAFHDAVYASNKNESLKSEHVRETLIVSASDSIKCKVEPMDVKFDHGVISGESAKFVLKEEEITEMHQNDIGRGYPVPGSAGDNWSDIEEASFLLGLYIFGKNLILVKKFVGSKKMGDVLSFYYGKFYRSDRYRRWSECQKRRSRKCIFGHRIFTGSRQQELLSRLLPDVSVECQNTLLEVSKTFGEGKILLEEYVFILKARFGLNALVEAVGIGKGKRDLTGIATETLKSNQAVPVRPEIPIGKACSTLTPLEIVNFLTGDFRLSKARSSDLFWEAVWPRLLARGWHSEQPSHGFSTGSKHSLVFLIPGIKKFSRRKLVKGSHYFDSVTDVLSKVASDPELLELDMGANKSSGSKDENGWTDETKLDEEDFPNQQRHCYLKPRTPKRNGDVVKFTVVDTSLSNGKTSKVRELRSLPFELNTPTSSSDSEDDDGDASESTDKSISADNLCSHRDEVNVPKAIKIRLGRKDDKYFEYDTSKWEHQVFVQGANIPEDDNVGLCNDMQPRKAMKCQKSRKMVSQNKNHVAPVSKRRRLAACSRAETTRSMDHVLQDRLLQQDACSSGGHLELSEKTPSQMDPSEEKLSSTSTSSRGGSPVFSGEGIPGRNNLHVEQPHEIPQPRTLIDLNIPISLDAETDEPFTMIERQDDQTSQELDEPHSVISSECRGTSEQQPTINSRRQSTRNRPLTTKVLEAFACGFLDTKQKRKSTDAFPGDSSKPSRRARTRKRVPDSFDASLADFNMQETTAAIHNSTADGFSKVDVVS
ncbi:hypothetical protein ACE6H2_001332 [Prunus campanulata]